MTQDLRRELAEMVEPASWRWLIPHTQRDAVVVVNPALDLVDVGVAIATDNVTHVQRWIGEALIAKPSPEQLSDWGEQADKQLNALIVQPYVLVQDPSVST